MQLPWSQELSEWIESLPPDEREALTKEEVSQKRAEIRCRDFRHALYALAVLAAVVVLGVSLGLGL